MNPLERVLDVESRLGAGAITVQQAASELFSGPKHWHTPWWKARRRERLGVACATCDTTKPPLVLQHTWQPRSWRQALREAGPLNWEGWKERHPLPKVDRPAVPLTERQVCPTCGSVSIYFRKRAENWACSVGMSGPQEERHPDHIFKEPSIALRMDTLGIRKRNRIATSKYDALSNARYQAWLGSAEYRENQINALRLRMQDTKRYLSFADTKTLCRRCAAREDHRHIIRNQRREAHRQLQISFAEFDLQE